MTHLMFNLFRERSQLPNKVLLLGRESDLQPTGALAAVRQVFHYSKIPCDEITPDRFLRHSLQLFRYACVILGPGVEVSLQGRAGKRLRRYLFSGGGIVAITPEVNESTASFFGHPQPEGENQGGLEDSLHILHDLFPGTRGMTIPDARAFPHSPLFMRNAEQVEIWAEMGSGESVLWHRQLKRGQVIVWNSSIALHRSGTGLLLQSVLATFPISVQCIVNAGVVHVDDFPAAFTDLPSKLLEKEFGMSFLPFLDFIWLPDMLRLSEKFQVPYTFAIPFSYNDKTAPPFDFAEWEHQKKLLKGAEILYPVYFAQRIPEEHELCFHGYNHLPLTSLYWQDNPKAIQKALAVAQDRWRQDALGPDPGVYVPPMNEIDSAGLQALRQSLPKLNTICGSYGEGPYPAGTGLFGPHPQHSHFFSLPRVSWGHEMDAEQQFLTTDLLANCGVWTHMLHPDDILETEVPPGTDYTPRNPFKKNWRTSGNSSLLSDFSQWLGYVKKNYPWLKFMTASKAASVFKKHLDHPVTLRISPRGVRIRSEVSRDFHLRIRQELSLVPGSLRNVDLIHSVAGDHYDLYTFHSLGREAYIHLRDKPPVNETGKDAAA